MPVLKYANHSTVLTKKQKEKMIERAAKYYGKYMDALGIDWKNDPNSLDTPYRVAKAFVVDLGAGCYSEEPKITAFENIKVILRCTHFVAIIISSSLELLT